MTVFEYDAFISHTSEDKENVMRPLVAELQKYGLNIWLDELTLRVGDSLRASIEEGLAQSRFGVVVFSHAFFSKNWPPAELNALFAREMAGQKVILPVWHGVTSEDMLRYAPIQADKLAANTSLGIPTVAKRLVEVIRPETFLIDVARKDAGLANSRLIEQLETRYPRYGFRIVTGEHADAVLSTPGLIGTQWTSGERIDICVKDPSALSSNPPSFSCKFVGTGITKIQEALRTGRAQKFLADEFMDFTSSLPLAEDVDSQDLSGRELHLIPKLPASTQTVTARVVFGIPPDEVVFPVVDFRGVRAGLEEVEILGTRKSLPFALRLTIPLHGPPTRVRFDIDFVGRDFRSIQIFSRGIAALRKSGRIKAVNLETEALLFQGEDVKLGTGGLDRKAFDAFVDDVVAIEEFYDVPLAWPSSFDDGDFRSMELLQCLKDDRPFEGTFTFTTETTKRDSEEENERILRGIDSGTMSLWVEPKEPSKFVLFGTCVFSGLVRIVVERAEVLNAHAAKAAFLLAPPGGAVSVAIRSCSPVSLRIVGERPPSGPDAGI
jgi:hypothetical protein